MIPSAFVSLETLPWLASGKILRHALPQPEQNRQDSTEAYVPPRTDDEKMIANIWAEVLKVDRIGVDDNFFDLGGHSLLATQVISRVREQSRIEIPVRALFETPTVAGLAATLLLRCPREMDQQNFADLISKVKLLSTEEVPDLLSGRALE
jgi:acyl carrier protein